MFVQRSRNSYKLNEDYCCISLETKESKHSQDPKLLKKVRYLPTYLPTSKFGSVTETVAKIINPYFRMLIILFFFFLSEYFYSKWRRTKIIEVLNCLEKVCRRHFPSQKIALKEAYFYQRNYPSFICTYM